MSRITTFSEAHKVLGGFVPKNGVEASYSLDGIVTLMEYLGNPQDSLKIVHVAGTSGKTSTCYYVAALLKAAGKKVGMTVSPHLHEVNERLQINLVPMLEKEFCQKLEDFLSIIANSGVKPTYFELLIALAYYEFAQQQVDYAVVEVGLGGLRDGTNVVSRADKVCIITDIGLDHLSVLGTTLTEIAAQKAGIIQPFNTVFCYRHAVEVLDVIKNRCDRQHAEVHIINGQSHTSELDFLPLFQQRNFGLAKNVVDYVLERDKAVPLRSEMLLTAAQTLIPGRMETFKFDGKIVILDGAHNAQKLQALVMSIKVRFPHQSVAVLLGFAAGREYRLEPAIQEITGLATAIIVTSFRSSQDTPHASVEPAVIADLCRKYNMTDVQVEPHSEQAVQLLLARPEPIVVVTGSFYLLNHIRPIMLET